MFPLPFTMGELASWRCHIELLMFKSHINKTVALFWISIPRITFIAGTLPRRYNMNGIFQMQGGKNWILPNEINANRFFWDSHWLEIWSNHFCPSMGPNGGSVATDSVQQLIQYGNWCFAFGRWGGGGEGPAWDSCFAPARNIPRNFLDLAFERRFLSLAW
jgi:hypothetical protein